MAVQTINSTVAPSSVATAASATSNSTLSQADFINLLTTQMQYQDPLNPISNTDMVTQLAQFSSMQGIQQLNTSITQLLLLQQVTQGAGLIGKQITYTVPGKTLATNGTVTSVQVANGAVQLMVGTQPVSLTQVTAVTAGK